ncbi:hypothetical protein [Niabella beijingensis]|uniref:hypothetical protein n=1 Tax=Niabella beijingensis TaxID=2872700 RepID=UPI001CBAC48B|nr:hypothetical protein [Niabella beijingensis]MBZ4189827.1 hypothetical protein [Niabella beijingensis]
MTAKKSPSLLFCILMDAIGYLSYAIPGLGELADVVWAPVSGLVFAFAFGGKKGMTGGLFNFIEEALPGTDFIPSFTIMWVLVNKTGYFNKKQVVPVKNR